MTTNEKLVLAAESYLDGLITTGEFRFKLIDELATDFFNDKETAALATALLNLKEKEGV